MPTLTKHEEYAVLESTKYRFHNDYASSGDSGNPTDHYAIYPSNLPGIFTRRRTYGGDQNVVVVPVGFRRLNPWEFDRATEYQGRGYSVKFYDTRSNGGINFWTECMGLRPDESLESYLFMTNAPEVYGTEPWRVEFKCKLP